MAINDLKYEIQDFIDNLSPSLIKSGYDTIYNAFVESINSKDQYNGQDAHYIIKERLNKVDIIDAGAHYINNSKKANSKTAIKKYVRAITKLYKDYFMRFDNKLLEFAYPFSSLTERIEEKVVKKLHDAKSAPPLSKDEYESIEYYLKNKRKIYSQQKTEIMLRMLLLYGFKYSKLQRIRIDDINLQEGLLNADNALPEGEFVKIPKQLLALIENYLKNPLSLKSELMFASKSGKPIASSTLSRTFKEIKSLRMNESLAFCPTGLAKYSIINQMKSGLSIPYIKRITGMEKDIIDDCIICFFEERNLYEDISISEAFIKLNNGG